MESLASPRECGAALQLRSAQNDNDTYETASPQILTRLRETVCCITRSNFLRFHLLVFPSADRLPAGRFGFVRATAGRPHRRNAANRISRFPFAAARSIFHRRAGPASESLSIRQTIRAGSGRSGAGLGTDV